MQPGLSLRVSQQLQLTPQLQQAIQLLQMSTLELEQQVEGMLLDNPFLEREEHDGHEGHEGDRAEGTGWEAGEADMRSLGPETAGPEGGDAPELPDMDQAMDWSGEESDIPSRDDGHYEHDGGNAAAGEENPLEWTDSMETLSEHLHRQALALHLDETGHAALRFLIENLNEDGYLEESLETLAQALAGDDRAAAAGLVQRFDAALRLLHQMEPVGVGARNLAECLTLQLREQQEQEQEQQDRAAPEGDGPLHTALLICTPAHLDLLARRDWRALARVCAKSEAQVRAAWELISRLEPRPARRFLPVQHNFIVPDVLVHTRRSKAGRVDFEVVLNPDVLPRLKVHDIYANALRGHRGNADLQQRLQEARWFIKNVQQRFETILRVSQAIVQRQKNFLLHGQIAMRPMILREVADALELHESTISRVTSAKYMATPHGTYELKYFFSPGLETEAGGSASSTAVRALIQQLVETENPKKPLSDGKIADLLKDQGIECARRTVAKYREQLQIPTTTLRRRAG